ncbi:LOW QUALITY PROTEIN: Hypothetical protein PHPALM_11486 [Phytophthora palmivora]|uniref:Uncharacterized protein n=1 Tax=Phytophthora palmivora TaxID=4796 RepID=A0A2P4Y267_9STRA|nr:LOW QUALITY PROTEIN: Hypothetical protein PHPALM_11486 [Phytophthora palmivora]
MALTSVSSPCEIPSVHPGRKADEDVPPVDELVNLCHSPLFTFFYIMPNSLWVMIDVDMKRKATIHSSQVGDIGWYGACRNFSD